MGKHDDAIRRHTEAAFAEQWATTAVARKAAADAFDNHQALLTRIAEQRVFMAQTPERNWIPVPAYFLLRRVKTPRGGEAFVSLGQQYLEKVNECTRNAGKAKTEPEQLSWLKLAEAYLRLMRWKDRDLFAFEAEVSDKGTGQTESAVSH